MSGEQNHGNISSEFVIVKGMIPRARKGGSLPADVLNLFFIQRCVEIQRASVTSKKSTFGDLSAEVADTLQLIGSVEMSDGRMKQAHGTMTKVITNHVLVTTCKYIYL